MQQNKFNGFKAKKVRDDSVVDYRKPAEELYTGQEKFSLQICRKAWREQKFCAQINQDKAWRITRYRYLQKIEEKQKIFRDIIENKYLGELQEIWEAFSLNIQKIISINIETNKFWLSKFKESNFDLLIIFVISFCRLRTAVDELSIVIETEQLVDNRYQQKKLEYQAKINMSNNKICYIIELINFINRFLPMLDISVGTKNIKNLSYKLLKIWRKFTKHKECFNLILSILESKNKILSLEINLISQYIHDIQNCYTIAEKNIAKTEAKINLLEEQAITFASSRKFSV